MRNNNVTIENARLIFKNFSGAPGKFNPAGNRNFNVLLDDEMAMTLAEAGWNVKVLPPRNPDELPLRILPVAISYKIYAPRIVLITSRGKTMINEDELSIFDFGEFTNIDLILNPSYYDFNGRKGIKAYLKAMYATIYEDELERKYMDVPDSAVGSIMPNEY